MTQEIPFRDMREKVREMSAEMGTEEAKEAIYDDDSTHVSEIWEDGEITYMKNGDMYGHRRRHQSNPPLLPSDAHLFEVPDDKDHSKRIITDDSLKELLQEATVKISMDEHGRHRLVHFEVDEDDD